MHVKSPLRAAVIGGGMMGALMDTPESTPPRSHAGGFLQHPDFNLTAICEPNPVDRLKEWPCKIYRQLEDMLTAEKLDIVSIAVPKEEQPRILLRLLNTDIRYVIAEKPLASSLKEALSVTDLYKKSGKQLLINLPRRYSTMYKNLGDKFKSDDEKVLCASIYYAKGLLHNGIHAIDLARMLFGEVTYTLPLAAYHDVFTNDPSVTAYLECRHCRQLHLNALDDACFTCFEVDIITDKARYVINNDHRNLHIAEVKDHVGIPPGRRLVATGTKETDYDQSLLNLMQNASDVARDRAEALCTADTMCQSHRIVENLYQSAREAGLV